MINKKVIILILFFFVQNVKGNDIVINLTNDTLLTVQSGQVITSAITLLNISQKTDSLKVEFDVPPQWRAIIDNKSFQILPQEKKINIFSFYVPKNTRSGYHYILYKVINSKTDKIVGSKIIRLFVEETEKISIKPVDAPAYLVAGEKINAKFIIENSGNSIQNISVKAYNCSLSGKRSFFLSPGDSKVVAVNAFTSSEIRSERKYSFRVEAKIKGKEDSKVHAYQNVRIIPSGEYKNYDFEPFPSHVRLTYLVRSLSDDEYVSGYQGEIFLKGNIKESKTDAFEIKLRGPDRFYLSTFGLYEEYYASVKTKRFYISLGDKNFRLTPLTEFSRYGRGIEGKIFIRRFELGAFYQQPRFYPFIKEGLASFAKFHFNEKNSIGINFLKNKYAEGQSEANLFSLSGSFSIIKKTRLDVEISKGISDDGVGEGAYLQFYSKSIKRLNLSSTLLYAGKYYPGYYRNTTKVSGNANFQATDRLNLSFTINRDEKNSSRDTLFATAPISNRLQAGISYRISTRLRLNAYGRKYELQDRMPDLKFHHRGDLIRFQMQYKITKLFLSITGETGRTENLLNDAGNRLSNTYRGYFDGTLRLSARNSIRGFVNYLDQNIYSNYEQKQWFYGLSLHSILFDRTKIDLFFQNNYVLEEYYRDRSLFELSIRQRIGKQHEISLMSRYALLQRFVDKKDFSINVCYTWFPNLRLLKKQNFGTLKGKILKRNNGDLSNILLILNGQTAITDNEGNFTFKLIPPGKYYLMIDRSSINLNEITSIQVPVEVIIEPAIENFISFDLKTGAKVFGEILSENAKANPFIIEMTNETETLRILSGNSGKFAFQGIRPGKWKLKVFSNGLQSNQYFEKEEFVFELEEGSEKEVNFTLIQKKKSIKFNQKEFFISEITD